MGICFRFFSFRSSAPFFLLLRWRICHVSRMKDGEAMFWPGRAWSSSRQCGRFVCLFVCCSYHCFSLCFGCNRNSSRWVQQMPHTCLLRPSLHSVLSTGNTAVRVPSRWIREVMPPAAATAVPPFFIFCYSFFLSREAAVFSPQF